ncbi:MAG: SURF1 family protein [Sphingomicrobium sp.]
MTVLLPRRYPLVPTILVAAAIATMIGLGLWQLRRAQWKEALIARYAQASKMPPIAFPTVPIDSKNLPLYRYATGNCVEVVGRRTVAGSNRGGEPGFAQVADCRTGAEGPGMAVVIGWSKDPKAGANWKGGPVSGIIGPDAVTRMHLVVDGAAPGLEPAAPPTVTSIPNNHRSYAVQWFLFALVAAVIYLLALRRFDQSKPSEGKPPEPKPPENEHQ